MTRLDEVLDLARDALLAGDLAALARLGPQLDALADTAVPQDRISTDRLRRKAERNARLLQAAARGVRAALGRLSEISSGPQLTTYDARGRRSTLGLLPDGALKRF